MTRWPSWRFEHRPNEAEVDEERKRTEAAKAEAAEALAKSYGQLEEVRDLNKRHGPVREGLRRMRETNHFAQDLLRVIEEGR